MSEKSNESKCYIYFDCNATTPVLPEAAQAAMSAMEISFGNPSSTHITGLQAKYLLEATRKKAAKAVGSQPNDIVFTSGATEAIQIAVFSALFEAAQKIRQQGPSAVTKRKLLYGQTEHKAVPTALHHWNKVLDLGFEVVPLPVDSTGQLRMEVFEEHAPHAWLVCTMAVNNETGVIHDLKKIETTLRAKNKDALWLVDGVQALGKMDINAAATTVDYMTFSGHKLYAPKGIGFLYARSSAPHHPLTVGGGQEGGFRSGTENLPGVAALGAILDLLTDPESILNKGKEQLTAMRDTLVETLKQAFPRIVFNTPFECSVPTTVNFSVQGFASKELLEVFDAAGVRLSSGSACGSGKAVRSYVLDAMGLPEWQSESAIRLSIGSALSQEEFQAGLQAIKKASEAMQMSCLLSTGSEFSPPAALRDGLIHLRYGSSNTWILADQGSREAILIDPLPELAERIGQFVRCQEIRLVAILDTHSHADHMSCRMMLETLLEKHLKSPDASRDSLGFYDTQSLTLGDGSKAPFLPLGAPKQDGSRLVVAKVNTPGHTSDSVTYLYGCSKDGVTLKKEDVIFAFVGDTILSGGLGRTNFESSSDKQMFESIKKLNAVLYDRTLLCSSHDYDNSFALRWGVEKKSNRLISAILSDGETASFSELKKKVDEGLAEKEKTATGIVCGIVSSQEINPDEVYIRPGELTPFLLKHGRFAHVVDVREPSEFSLFKDWEHMGFKASPQNVPLSRLVNFMATKIRDFAFEDKIVFICRSGNRSLQAAKCMRRNGHSHAWSVDGGVAYGCVDERLPSAW